MLSLRAVLPADLDVIVRHRERMFRDSGRPEEVIAALVEPFRVWLQPRLGDGRYFGWMIEEDGRVLAGIGMMAIDWPPHPAHPASDKRGYILNVYVEPDCRRRGLARQLMEKAMAEAKAIGLTYVILHATAQGRRLYEALGWSSTAEMAISLADA